MRLQDIDWTQTYRSCRRSFDGTVPGSDEARSNWDAKAPKFAHKPKRSDYIHQLISLLDLEAGDTIFDMGCGSGTLAIPLAEKGHEIVAVDFSHGMLDELVRTATERGVADRIEVFQRSWQEEWGGLPIADVAVSSRSFLTDDLADGIVKLESKARKHVVLTCGAGDLPYKDARLLKALGREEIALMLPTELLSIVGYLMMKGRLPRVDYIEYPGVWSRHSRAGLVEDTRAVYAPFTPSEERILEEYLNEHIVYNEDCNRWSLDYARCDRWAVISWDV